MIYRLIYRNTKVFKKPPKKEDNYNDERKLQTNQIN